MDKNKDIDVDNLELASLGARLKAFVIDDILITVLVIVLYWDTYSQVSNDMEAMLQVMNSTVMQVLFIKFIYQGFFVWYYGATIGKIIAKIRVIDYNTYGRVSLISAFFRSTFRIVSEMFFYVGFILAYFTDGRQTFHDKVSRTLVVNA